MKTRQPSVIPGDWHAGVVPANVMIERGAHVETSHSFLLHRSRRITSVWIGRGAAVYQGTMFDLGPRARVTIGRFSLVNGAWIVSDAEVHIGGHALVAWNVVIMDTYRAAADPALRRPQLRQAARRRRMIPTDGTAPRAVHIGANVWVGFDCCILPGVTIGAGAVIGARSVVTTDVPAYTVYAGNPARFVRRLGRNGGTRHASAKA